MNNPSKTITQWQTDAYENSKAHGWWEGVTLDVNTTLAKLALIHSEVSEALEGVRVGAPEYEEVKGKPEGVGIELADVLIRIFDLAEAKGYDLEKCLAIKHAYNVSRPHRHGGKLA